jgi:hypothetical protein
VNYGRESVSLLDALLAECLLEVGPKRWDVGRPASHENPLHLAGFDAGCLERLLDGLPDQIELWSDHRLER